uniref:Uncharacterized protein n=1 Tax=Nonomuraea gerenzanensis TaxID=93944 RepID=A0A1M4EBE1_9ACTN|nr:hypothetical protein BN4615_P5602 [Nonomuraea gerenzanensis]
MFRTGLIPPSRRPITTAGSSGGPPRGIRRARGASGKRSSPSRSGRSSWCRVTGRTSRCGTAAACALLPAPP